MTHDIINVYSKLRLFLTIVHICNIHFTTYKRRNQSKNMYLRREKKYIWVISWEIYSKKFFFDETFFLPFYFENNRHVFFFQCDTWKFQDIIFLSLALGKNFFFQQLTVKAVLNIKCNPCTWNARKSTSFQKSYSTHFVVFL